jgi:hypothetical protein
VFKFLLLESDESLQQQVERLLMVPGFFDSGIGPSSDTALVYKILYIKFVCRVEKHECRTGGQVALRILAIYVYGC